MLNENWIYSDRFCFDFSDAIIIVKSVNSGSNLKKNCIKKRKNFIFTWMLWWKNCWKWLKLLRWKKTHIFQTIKDIANLNEDCVKILRPYLLCFQRNEPSKSVTVGRAGPGWFVVSKESACPKMVIKMHFNFFLFRKKLEINELVYILVSFLYDQILYTMKDLTYHRYRSLVICVKILSVTTENFSDLLFIYWWIHWMLTIVSITSSFLLIKSTTL